MKQITIAGRTGKPGTLRHTDKGDSVLSFSLAVDDGYGENKTTMWFDCSLWGKRASSLEPHINKGTAMTVVGDLGRREHEGKTYLTVRVSELTLQGGEKPTAKQDRSTSYDRDDSRTTGSTSRDLDDEIPF